MKKKYYTKVLVADLITEMWVKDGFVNSFGVLDPNDMDGSIQALCVGPKLTNQGKKYLIESFQATPDGFSDNEFRCEILIAKLVFFADWLEREFRNHYLLEGSKFIDWNFNTELNTKLFAPYWSEVSPPLKKEDCNELMLKHLKFVRISVLATQKHKPNSQEAEVRFFNLWQLQIKHIAVWRQLMACPAFKLLDQAALDTTHGGTRIGQYGTFQLANNLGL